MQVKSNAECSKGEHSKILSTIIKQHVPIAIKIIVLSMFEWPFYTGFTLSVIRIWLAVSSRQLYSWNPAAGGLLPI